MQVRRNFEAIYTAETDPWSIGGAEAARYDRYLDRLLAHRVGRKRILDIGCGLGAFLSRFEDHFDELVGIDVSAEAVRRAAERFPGIRFLQGSLDRLEETGAEGLRFDAIVVSDVLCYLDESGKRRALSWVASHLDDGGVALIAGWSPGGSYLEPDEFHNLLRHDFRVLHSETLDTRHVLAVCQRRRSLVALTFDVETWQPIPEGRVIDWSRDVIEPTRTLIDRAASLHIPVTLFVEVGEVMWLDENEPAIVREMEALWEDAVRLGHDIQLHLHPAWLPELGARVEAGVWSWDWSRSKAGDYPGDLTDLIARCKHRLERVTRAIEPTHTITCFRAGAYQAQPFRRLHAALVESGIAFDSSVFAGGKSSERGYDYTLAWSTGQPYFASRSDPQLKAPPSEQRIVELPIATPSRGRRLQLDGEEGERFASRLLAATRREDRGVLTSERLRRRKRARKFASAIYGRLGRLRATASRTLPRPILHLVAAARPEIRCWHRYAVAIGHSKGDLRVDAVLDGALTLRNAGWEIVTLSELGATAIDELSAHLRSASEEARFQVERDRAAVMGEARNLRQSRLLQEMIPLDRERVLDLGCGTGYWADRIAGLYPWMTVVGIDIGQEFVDRAIDRYASERVSFLVGDFAALPVGDEAFDCVYADNTLEHAWDVDHALAEVSRVLREGGVLVAAIPSDARNPETTADDHTWKTAPHDVEERLHHAGFTNVSLHEVDTLRSLGMAPYPPSVDRMMYVRAWKRATEATDLDRATEAMTWVHNRLEPADHGQSTDPIEIIAGGQALCAGSVAALGELLTREAFEVRWVTMVARDHPNGRGASHEDTHEVLAVRLADTEVVLDPMAATTIPHPLADVLATPSLATGNPRPSDRHRERRYDLYDSEYWYSRVVRWRSSRRYRRRSPIWRRTVSTSDVGRRDTSREAP